MRIESANDKRERLARILGADQPSVFDMVDRANYASDEEYLDAVTKAEMERQSPEYQAVYRRLAGEYKARQEEEIRKEQAEVYREIRANTTLTSFDIKQIDEEASALARRDLVSGKITASELGKAIEKHAKRLSEKRKDEKASNAQFNSMIRSLGKSMTPVDSQEDHGSSQPAIINCSLGASVGGAAWSRRDNSENAVVNDFIRASAL